MPTDTIDFVPETAAADGIDFTPEAQAVDTIDFTPELATRPVRAASPLDIIAGEAEPGAVIGAYRALRDAPPVQALLGQRGGEPMRGEAASKIDRFGLVPGMFMPSDKVNTRSLRAGPQETSGKQLAAGVYNAGLGLIDSLLSPGALLSMGTGQAVASAPSLLRLMSGVFGADMAKSAIQAVPEAKRAYDRGDLQVAAETATSALLSGTMAVGAVAHAFGGERLQLRARQEETGKATPEKTPATETGPTREERPQPPGETVPAPQVGTSDVIDFVPEAGVEIQAEPRPEPAKAVVTDVPGQEGQIAQNRLVAPVGESPEISSMPAEIASAAGLPEAPIVLQRGFQNWNKDGSAGTGWGWEHIHQKHGEEIAKAGYANLWDFIRQTVSDYDQVYLDEDGRIHFVRSIGPARVATVALRPAWGNYTVVRAHLLSKPKVKNAQLLWEKRRGSSPSDTELASPISFTPAAPDEIGAQSSGATGPGVAAVGESLPASEPTVNPVSPSPSAPPSDAVEGLPAGTTPITGGRMPVALNRVAPGTDVISIPEVFRHYEDAMRAVGTRTPIRWGRMGQAARWASGFFGPYAEVIRLNTADNISTAAHEIAHAIDKKLFRQTGNPLHTTTPPDVRAELVNLGRALYGSRRPAAGYTSEGFSELIRHWLTTDDAAKVAPKATQWLETQVYGSHGPLAEAMQSAKKATDLWREQGAYGRAQAQMAPPASAGQALRDKLRRGINAQSLIEEATPLELIGKTHRELTGKRMPTAQDPFAIYTAKRGAAPKVLSTMLQDGMIDIHGRPTDDPGLHEALKPIRGKQDVEKFAYYLWARRAIERWGQPEPKNPGLSLADATHLKQQLENPRFQKAAEGYHKWWDGVLDYYAQASPANAELAARIRNGSSDYVPLPRVLPENLARIGEAARSPDGLKKMKGSGLGIRNIYESTIKTASSLIEKAHRDAALEAVFNAGKHEGMGWLVEEVPKDQVPSQVSLAKLREELEKSGIDTKGISDDTVLTYFNDAQNPHGWDSVMKRRIEGGQTKWYQVNPEIAKVFQGNPDAGKLAEPFHAAFSLAARGFKLGTTGLRAAFAPYNAIRDFQSFLVQSHFTGNPAKLLHAYISAWVDQIRGGAAELGLGKTPDQLKMLHELGVPMANWIAGDIRGTRREMRHLFHGRILRRVLSPVETLRDLIGTAENVPRLAELKLGLDHFGWKPGDPITPEQALQLTIASKRVTTDFTARGGGDFYRQMQRYAPFFGAGVQGFRTAARTLKGDRLVGPERAKSRIALQMGLWGGTIMAWNLANWWRNKDKDWYQSLPARERYLYTYVEGKNGILYQIPRPQEWGSAFMVAPEALMDTWYRRDPKSAIQGFEHIASVLMPNVIPTPLQATYEQARNKSIFFDRPIVPRYQQDLPPGEQRNQYTSKVAAWLGDAFPNSISPERVDMALRQFGGGALPDLLNAVGLGASKVNREPEPADSGIAGIPGRFYRRGGQYSANNQHLSDFFDAYTLMEARRRSKARPMTATEQAYWQALKPSHDAIKTTMDIARRTHDLAPRQNLYHNAAREAERIVNMGRRMKVIE